MPMCPCGSTKTYAQCCQAIHDNHANATYPEQVMRARYTAHELKLVNFVVNTYHPSCNATDEIDMIANSVNIEWCRLDVISASEPEPDANVGFVEFKAYLLDDGIEHCMHERSRFIKENGLWYYMDGIALDENVNKVGRNEPCVCGSGKKYKKCCGK